MARVCTIEGCGLPHLARGWCNKHYERWRRYGNPNTVHTRGTRREVATSATTLPPTAPASPGPTDGPEQPDTATHNGHAGMVAHTCSGTLPDGTACERAVREQHGFCLLHDPIRAMLRQPNPKPRKRPGATDGLMLVAREYEQVPVDRLAGV